MFLLVCSHFAISFVFEFSTLSSLFSLEISFVSCGLTGACVHVCVSPWCGVVLPSALLVFRLLAVYLKYSAIMVYILTVEYIIVLFCPFRGFHLIHTSTYCLLNQIHGRKSIGDDTR